MRTRSARFRTVLGATGLALSLLGSSAGCGGGPETGNATPKSATGGLQASPERAAAPSQGAVDKEFRALEKNRQVRIGAYAIDTGDGRAVGYRAGERFPFLSTFKAVVCGAVLQKARRSDPGLMDRVIRYKESDLVDHSPVTEKHVKTGMTVAELCRAAIVVSDNTAANLVLKQIGGPAGDTAFFRSLGDRHSRHDRWEPEANDWKPGEVRDTLVPRGWAHGLRTLTTGNALAPADRTRLIGWMKATESGADRIRAGLPEGWTAGNKTGTGGVYGTANDTAIAWPPSGEAPLIIVVTTNRRAADGTEDPAAIAKAASALVRALRPAG
ncbi:class A beta-lactamase [Actinomadura sp. 7K507]|uniref:class A beta-lactamase n=1 Tax=Actinomadura sp. 7K507 TaxID=2530365 RepID=UPI001052AA91|nr:class A beta-lactamase [Actinomadura sp. 7K507]TDC87304.1 class A beta-lactamase [Actinomadura sp. 7K507]